MRDGHMSTVTIPPTCQCGSIGRTDLRQCPDHHHIWRGDVRLTSVGRIVAHSFPLDPSIPADKLENARDRGSEVDKLFAAYVLGKLDRIPAGTRKDVFKDEAPYDGLLQKLMKWYDQQGFLKIESQVLLGGEDHGGVLDLKFNGVPVELKSTYEILDSHRLQVAGYDRLGDSTNMAAILHVTERLKEPRLVPIGASDYRDWDIALSHYRMLKRRGAWKERD